MYSLNELISEYALVTGRPVATISVSEYLEFKKYSEGRAGMPNATLAETPTAYLGSDPDNQGTNEASAYEMPTVEAIVADEPKTQAEKKPISSAFMMMRSISG